MRIRIDYLIDTKRHETINVDGWIASLLLYALFASDLVPLAESSVTIYVQQKHAQLYVDGLPVLTLERMV